MRSSRADEENRPAPRHPSSLAVYRFVAGLTQEELAQRARVTRETIGNLEADRHQPRRLTARALAEVLRVEPGLLFPQSDHGPGANRAERPRIADDGGDRGPS